MVRSVLCRLHARLAVAACLVLALWAAVPGVRSALAHDVPSDVRIIGFVKPAGPKLELLVRVPMAALQDIEYPLKDRAYLVVSKADEALRAAAKMWIVDKTRITENGRPLPAPSITAVRVALPSDTSFTDYDKARANVLSQRLSDELDLVWSQQLVDILLAYPIDSDRSRFAIDTDVSRLGLNVQTSLRFLPPGSGVRAYEFHGNAGTIELDPRWFQSAWRFLVSGIEHILSGIDHLLFVACLVIPFRRVRPLIAIVTAFTVAHSLTLLASAMGFVPDVLWFPPLIETLIAVTILYMAVENIFGSTVERRWLLAFAFGLIHGFGFSFALAESLQFAGSHLLTALVTFNIGVEIGQLVALAVLVPALTLLFRRIDERLAVIVLSAFVAHTAWHWMLERGADLAKFPLPRIDAAFLAGLAQGAVALLALAALVWIVQGYVRRWLGLAQASKTTG